MRTERRECSSCGSILDGTVSPLGNEATRKSIIDLSESAVKLATRLQLIQTYLDEGTQASRNVAEMLSDDLALDIVKILELSKRRDLEEIMTGVRVSDVGFVGNCKMTFMWDDHSPWGVRGLGVRNLPFARGLPLVSTPHEVISVDYLDPQEGNTNSLSLEKWKAQPFMCVWQPHAVAGDPRQLTVGELVYAVRNKRAAHVDLLPSEPRSKKEVIADCFSRLPFMRRYFRSVIIIMAKMMYDAVLPVCARHNLKLPSYRLKLNVELSLASPRYEGAVFDKTQNWTNVWNDPYSCMEPAPMEFFFGNDVSPDDVAAKYRQLMGKRNDGRCVACPFPRAYNVPARFSSGFTTTMDGVAKSVAASAVSGIERFDSGPYGLAGKPDAGAD